MFIKFLENLLLIRTIAFHRKQNFAGRILKIFLFKCEKIKMATKYLSISKKKKYFFSNRKILRICLNIFMISIIYSFFLILYYLFFKLKGENFD